MAVRRLRVILILSLLLFGVAILYQMSRPPVSVDSFETCEQAGYEVQEGDPRRCISRDGTIYTESSPKGTH